MAIIAWAARGLKRDWKQIGEESIDWDLDPALIIVSLIITWAMYLMLIYAWRAVLQAWGDHLAFRSAVRIWFVSSLGKYVPGKLWALAAMAVLAERAGVSGGAATASSIVMQLLSITTGIAIAIALLGSTVVGDSTSLGFVGVVALMTVALAGTSMVASPRIMNWLGRVIGRPGGVRHVGVNALALAAIPSAIAWLGYGTALYLLVLGTLPAVTLSWSLATGAFAASYVAGYLAVIAPGGLGVREAALILILGPTIGHGNVLAIAFASRLTLTLNELGVALPLLFFGRSSRDIT